jgi:hypothetical protein
MASLNDLQDAIKKFGLAAPGIVQRVSEPPIEMIRDWSNPEAWKDYRAPAGVYVILNDKYEVLYVGYSIDPAGRLNDYFRAAEPTREPHKDWPGHLPTYVLFVMGNNVREAKFLERWLIYWLDPPFNKD